MIDGVRQVIDLVYPGDAQVLHGHLNALPGPDTAARGRDLGREHRAAKRHAPAGRRRGPRVPGLHPIPTGSPQALRERLRLN